MSIVTKLSTLSVITVMRSFQLLTNAVLFAVFQSLYSDCWVLFLFLASM